MTLRIRQEFLLVSLLVVGTLGGVLVYEYSTQRSTVVEEARGDVETTVAVTAHSLDQRFAAKRRTVAAVAGDPRMAAPGRAGQRRALDAVLNRTRFDGMSVVAANGTMVAIRGVDPVARRQVVGTDFGDRTYVQRALAGETYVSDGFRAETDNVVVVISAPIERNGTVVGTLNGAFHVGESAFFEDVAATRTRGWVVVRGGDRIVYAGDGTGDAVADASIVASTRMNTTGWTVTVGRERSVVTRQVRQRVLGQLVAWFVVFCVVAAFGWWVYRTTVVGTRSVGAALRDIEYREYDVDLDLRGATEWQEIGTAIERVAETLDERETMLLVLNRLLRHNLRNSLNVVLGRANLIADRTDDEQLAAWAGEVSAETEALLDVGSKAGVTETLLESPPVEDLPVVDAAALVDARAERFRRENPGTTVTVTTRRPAFVRADEQLARAVDELVENVEDHAGSAPTVEFTVETGEGTVTVVVADDGPGVPDDDRAVVTGVRPVSQVHHAGGVGLWIVDWVARRLDGQFHLETDDGTRAVVRLPAVPGPATVEAASLLCEQTAASRANVRESSGTAPQ